MQETTNVSQQERPQRGGQGAQPTRHLSNDTLSAPLLQIKASAGSGKTYELTRRFLLRLASARVDARSSACTLAASAPAAWGDIVAVTFTNAAATEMKDRVIATLKEWALARERTQDACMSRALARQWVDRILRQFGALNIRTIDSLLYMVTRAAALDLDLPPEFEPVFATEEALLPVLDMLMEEAWRHDAPMRALLSDACRSLVYRQDRKGFLLGDTLLDQLRPLLDGALLGQYHNLSSPEELEENVHRRQQELWQAAAALDAQAASAALVWKKLARESLNRLMAGGSPLERQGRAQATAWWQKEAKTAWWQKASLNECLLKSSPVPDEAAEAAFQAVVTSITRLNTEGRLLLGGLARAPFLLLAQALADSFDAQVQADGKVPSVLIPSKAASVLGGEHAAPDMICRMGSRLTHFLIDEFQDTSHAQWDALQPLVEQALSQGGSLTWVGDVKQAIYSWRGGDSSLFDSIGCLPVLLDIAKKTEQYPLEKNWRSRATVIAANNTLFSLLENPKNAASVLRLCLPAGTPDELLGADAAGAQAIARAFAKTAQKVNDKDGGYVSVQAVERGDSDMPDDADENPGEQLNAAVRQALLDKVNDIGTRRPWGDVAILVRSNTQASLAAGWLMEAGVPVFTENSLLLNKHPLIEQTVAFLRFLYNQEDDIACFTCMAGPMLESLPEACAEGFSRQSLTDMAASGRAGKPLHKKVRQAFPQTWEGIFLPFFLQAGLMSPYDSVQEWFSRLQVHTRFPEDAAFIRRFLEVIYAAETQGYSTLPAFLDHWDTHGDEEKIPMADGIDAVRIITMHKAKGLEYPVVILPWMNFSVRADSAPVPVEVDGLRLLAPLCKEMGTPYYQALAAAAQEGLHLLYVAWTRARDELHCFHCATPPKGRHQSLAPALDWLLEQAGMTPPYTAGLPTPCAAGKKPALLPAADKQTETEMASDALPAPQNATAKPADAVSSPNAGQQLSLLSLLQTSTAPRRNWRPMGWLPSLKVYRNPLGALLSSPEPEDTDEMPEETVQMPDIRKPESTPTAEGTSDTHETENRPLSLLPARIGALRGTLMHAALEHIRLTGHPEADAAAAVRHALRTSADPLPDVPHLAEQLTRGAAWFAALPEAQVWKQHGIPEQSLLDAQGEEHRVDLLLETSEGFLALEFKTGAPTEDHVRQVRRYLHLLTQMDQRPAQGLLLYLDKRCCRSVTAESCSPLEASPRACGMHSRLPEMHA